MMGWIIIWERRLQAWAVKPKRQQRGTLALPRRDLGSAAMGHSSISQVLPLTWPPAIPTHHTFMSIDVILPGIGRWIKASGQGDRHVGQILGRARVHPHSTAGEFALRGQHLLRGGPHQGPDLHL